MATTHTRSPKMGVSQSLSRVRIRSPSVRRKQTSISGDIDDQRADFLGSSGMENVGGLGRNGNKVMVVVNSSIEAKGALDWALSHTLQSQDTLLLLHVTKSSKSTDPDCNMSKVNLRAYEFLHSLKNFCQTKRPGVEVEIGICGGKEKGAIIVEEAKRRKVSLLVLGQRKRSIMWRLMRQWGGRRNGGSSGGAAEYCIQNSPCMTIAVRRKGKKLGGYLITTKRHKNFWLLA